MQLYSCVNVQVFNLTRVVNAKASLISSCYTAATNTTINLHAEVLFVLNFFKILVLGI